MESVLIKVAAFLVIIFGGYALKRIGFFRVDDFRLISTVVLKITLPCAVISNFGRIEVEAALYSLVLLGVILNLVTIGPVLLSRYLIAAVLAWLLYTFAPFDAEVRKVLAVIAFAPLSAVCAIFTAQCFDDPARVALSCTINSLSIVCSIVFMTALMLAL